MLSRRQISERRFGGPLLSTALQHRLHNSVSALGLPSVSFRTSPCRLDVASIDVIDRTSSSIVE